MKKGLYQRTKGSDAAQSDSNTHGIIQRIAS